MLFFKEMIQNKFEDPAFRKLYEKECHICSTTVKIIAVLEGIGHSLAGILKRLDISDEAWSDLKDAEYCNPLIVKKMCNYLDFKDTDLFKHCPRLKDNIF